MPHIHVRTRSVVHQRVPPTVPSPGARPHYVVAGPIGEDCEVEYDPAPAESALHALFDVHRDGLGGDRVQLVAGRLRFATAGDRLECAGLWRVTPLGGEPVLFRIPEVDLELDVPTGSDRQAA
jgi:hypothetical protein